MELDAGRNHQNLEGVIARNVSGSNVVRLARTWPHSLSNKRRFIHWLFIYVGMRAAAFRIEFFSVSFSGSAILAVRPSGQSQMLQRDGFCGRQASYGALHMPN